MWVFILSFLFSAFKNFSLYEKMNKQDTVGILKEQCSEEIKQQF